MEFPDTYHMRLQIISPYENLMLILLLLGTAYSVIKIKGESHKDRRKDASASGMKVDIRWCKCCQSGVVNKDHHCVMVDSCISRSNIGYFTLFLFLMSLTLWHASFLFLTSVCEHMLVANGMVLVPKDCAVLNDKFEVRRLINDGIKKCKTCVCV
jgi:hypothetical protein